MLFFILLSSCLKVNLNQVDKIFSFESLEEEKNQSNEIIQDLGLSDTLKNIFSTILLQSSLEDNGDNIKKILPMHLAILENPLNENSFKEYISSKDSEGLTSFHYTALFGKVFEPALNALVLSKSEIQDKENDKKRERILSILKEKDNYGRTWLHLAFLSKNIVLCKSIFNYLNEQEREAFLKERDNNGENCFHYLAVSDSLKGYVDKSGMIRLMTFLDSIEEYLKLDNTKEKSFFNRDNKGLTPLHYAAYFGNLELCKDLINFGVNENILANIRSEEITGLGRITPLDAAYLSGELEVIRYFEEGIIKEKGEKKRIKDFFTKTAGGDKITFEFVIRSRKKEVISYYLSRNKYDFKQKLEKGKGTILHILIENGMERDALIFLSELEYLKEEEREEFLKHRDGKGEEALYLAVDRNFKEVVYKILDLNSERARCARLGFRDGIDFTLLDKAIFKNNMESLFFVLDLRRKYESEQMDDFTGKFNGKLAQSLKKIYELVISRKEDKIKEEDKIDEKSTFLSFLEVCLKNKGIEKTINIEEFLINMSQEDREEALLIASSLGDEKILRYLIGLGVDSNKVYENGETTLMYAGFYAKKETLNVLLDNGANVNHFTPNGCQAGRTVLMFAIENGKKEVVEIFLCKEAKVDIVDKSGRTALSVASENGHKEVVELLLSKGVEIDKVDGRYGRTALYVASFNGHKEVVELLLSKGAEIDNVDGRYGRTALYGASCRGHKEVVELLLTKGAEIDKGDITALYLASSNGHKEVVELLLIKGAKIDKVGGMYGTALSVASSNGHKEVVELLLIRGAKIDKVGGMYGTALYGASSNGHKEVVELLLIKGAKIDKVGGMDGTALYVASENGHKEVVELLLIRGAKIDKVGGMYGIALYGASSNGHKEVVELLLTNGAKIDKVGGRYRTLLYVMNSNAHKEVVGLLLTKEAEIDKGDITALYVASSNGHKEVVEFLLTKGAEIDKGDITALYGASSNGHKEVVELLLTKEANIYKASNSGLTPFMVVDLLNRQEIIHIFANKLNVVPSDEVIYGKDVKQIIENILPKEIKINKDSFLFLYEKRDLWLSLIASMAEKIKDSSLCIDSGLLLKEDFLDKYKVLADLLPFSYIEENFHKIEKLNRYEYNGLHFAVLKNSPDDLKKLLKLPIFKSFVSDVNNDKKQESPLLLAKRLSKEEHMKILLSFGAHPDIEKGKSIFDIVNIREYVKNEMLLDVLKDGRVEDASKLIFTLSYKDIIDLGKDEYKLISPIYKDMIDLSVKDECGRNVFHYLAEYAFDEMEVEHILNHLSEKIEGNFVFKYFKIEQFFEYDKEGYAPFYLALINSNEYFIRYFLSNEELRERAIKSAENLKSIEDIVSEFRVTKEIVDILKEYIWKKDNKEELFETLLEILKEDNVEELERMFKSKKLEFRLSENFLEEIGEKSIAFGAINCWELANSKQSFLKNTDEINNGSRAEVQHASKAEEVALTAEMELGSRQEAFGKMNKIYPLIEQPGTMMEYEEEEDKDISKFLEFSAENNIMVKFKDVTSFMMASYNGHLGEVKSIIEVVGSDGIDLASSEGRTALMLAAFRNKVEVVELLLSKGADISKVDKKGRTALIWASYSADTSVLKLLLDKGSEIDRAAENGWTALMIATLHKRVDAVKILISYGVDVEKSKVDGLNAIMLADLLLLLQERGLLNENSGYYRIILDIFLEKLGYKREDIYKTQSGKEKESILREILSKQIEIFRRYNFELSRKLIIALSIKINNSSLSLDAGVLINENSLRVYEELSNFLSISYIKDNFYKIEKLNKYSYNGLYFCVIKEREEDLKELLMYREDIKNMIDGLNNYIESESCISLAARLNKISHIKLLISFGASPTYSSNGKNLIDTVLSIPEVKRYAREEMLFDVFRDGRSEDGVKIVYNSGKEGGSYVLNYRDVIDLGIKDESGRNVFHYLAEYSFDQMDTEHFLNYVSEKVDGNFVFKSFKIEQFFEYDKKGDTPFYLALIKSNEYFVRYFLSNEDLRESAIKGIEKLRSIEDIIAEFKITKEVVDILKEHMFKREDKEEFSEILLKILKDDNIEELKKMFNSKKSESGLSENFLEEIREQAIALGAIKCWELAISIRADLEKSAKFK